jgi:predicted permease
MTLDQAAVRLYRALAQAFPSEFLQRYGSELTDVAEDVVRDAARRGDRIRLVWLVARLLANLAVRIAAEHVSDVVQDARYAVRILARAPGFTLASVTCLAIGTGLAAAMYAQVQATVLRELPGVRDPAALVRLHKPTTFANVEDLRDRSGQFAELAAYMGPIPFAIRGDGVESERIWGHLTTPDYFDVLGVRAARGRLPGPEDRMQSAGPAAVVSDRLWKSRFGGQPSFIGQSIRLNGQLVTVVGVAPPGFLGASPMTSAADIWIPTTADSRVAPELGQLWDRRVSTFEIIGRLAPGVAPTQAEAALETFVRRLEAIHNDPGRHSQEPRIRVLPGGRVFAVRDEDLPRAIGFPLVLVSLVLVMACGNVANLVLARSAARRREIAVRLSLGASRGRIVRQLLTESFMLVGLGAAGAAAFAVWLLSVFDAMRPVIPGYVQYEVNFDWSAFAFAALVAAASSTLFGVAPSFRASREDIYAGLKPAAPSRLHARRWFGMRNFLVFQQVAVSIVLVMLTGFVVVGWRRAAHVDVGFDAPNLYFMGVDPVRDGYTPERARTFFDALPERLRRVPGVTSVSLAQSLPLAMSSSEMILSARSDLASGTQLLGATRVDRVGTGFFETVGTALRRGRAFTDADETDEARALIVNETMATRAWPDRDPLGQAVDLDGETWQVVGVVHDIRSAFPLAPTLPALYKPVTPGGFVSPSRHGVTVAVRVVPGFDAPTRLRREVAAIDPEVMVFQVKRMTDEVDQALFLARVATLVYGGMGIFGLILASVGLAGVTAYAVSRRTHEIGIRMALGARRADVLWLILREGGAIAVAGTVTGVVAALALTRALGAVVEALAETTRTSVSDPLLLVGGPGLLIGIALAACYLPARRSTRIDPVSALRAE